MTYDVSAFLKAPSIKITIKVHFMKKLRIDPEISIPCPRPGCHRKVKIRMSQIQSRKNVFAVLLRQFAQTREKLEKQ